MTVNKLDDLSLSLMKLADVDLLSMPISAESDYQEQLRQYEKNTCALCGEPLKIYLANYFCKAHVKCLLKQVKKAEPTCS